MAAHLIVKLHGEEVARLTLETGKEYVAGRAPDAAIRLESQRGISRHHLKFYESDGGWVCESLSKFGPLQRGTQTMEVLELNQTMVFSVAPYEFYFESDAPIKSATANGASEGFAPAVGFDAPDPQGGPNLPAFIQPRVTSAGGSVNTGASDEAPTTIQGNSEATRAGKGNLVPYFRVSYPNTADDEILKLEGQLWVAGRDSDCEIPIESPHISRKHFEIARTKEGYFITDLGSSNGTKLKGQQIPPHEPVPLESGDEIRVMNIGMTFEIRDTQFANRLSSLPVQTLDPLLASPMAMAPLLPSSYPLYQGGDPTQYLGAEERDARKAKGWKGRWRRLKKNKVRLALLILAPLFLLFALSPKKQDRGTAVRDPAGSPTFETLTKEQKLIVKDSFNLARNLYVQGKYALCLTELAKLHEVIAQYENSKELQSFCEQGLELVRRQEDLDRKERERAMIESQITGYVDACKQKLKPESTVEEARQCLAPAIELAPEHPLVIEMIHSAQMHEEEQKFLAKQKQAEDAKAAKGVAHFNRAINKYKSGQLAGSIAEFDRFLNATYPHADGLKEDARRQIASIKKELKTKVDSLLDRCRSLRSKSRMKEAYSACGHALAEDPENSSAKDLREQILTDLRREMKNIYEDSVLEESLGNVDSAKEKWRKIIQEDVDADDYSVKAKSKLKKYGTN